ncbi:very-long-chain (3R)-3-hydroxyacyl-CoA dehydratase 3-like [Glandiceps talaboti]
MAEHPSPIVLWAQRNDSISLKVDLKDVQNANVDIQDKVLHFKGIGIGAGGEQVYEFILNFYDYVEPKKCVYRVTPRCVEFNVVKDGAYFWPRLTRKEKKPVWLRIDFDKWKDEDDTEEEEEPPRMPEDPNIALREIEERLRKTESDAMEEIKKGYLFTYNLLQFIGFFIVGYLLLTGFQQYGSGNYEEVFNNAGGVLCICQVGAILEVVNPVLGIVKTGVAAPMMQLYGRNFLLFLVIIPEKSMYEKSAVTWLIFVWTLVELFRYPFYMLSAIGKESKLITWLRYTVWIPLYPLGFLLEAICIYEATSLYEKSGKFSLTLPNALNFSWNFPMWLWCDVAIRIFIGMPFLLKHMYISRKRKLHQRKKKTA